MRVDYVAEKYALLLVQQHLSTVRFPTQTRQPALAQPHLLLSLCLMLRARENNTGRVRATTRRFGLRGMWRASSALTSAASSWFSRSCSIFTLRCSSSLSRRKPNISRCCASTSSLTCHGQVECSSLRVGMATARRTYRLGPSSPSFRLANASWAAASSSWSPAFSPSARSRSDLTRSSSPEAALAIAFCGD